MTILEGTLTSSSSSPVLQETGNTLKDLDTNISSLQSQYSPGSVADFNSVMQSVSQLAYQTRQTAEQRQLGEQFDPTKVSGGTFSDIMSWTEKHRGADVSRISQSTMRAREESQRQIGSTLESLKSDRNKLKADAKNFKLEMSAKYPGMYDALSDDEKRSIDNGDPSQAVFAKFDQYALEAQRKEEAWEAEKRNMQRASYARTTKSNAMEKEMNAYFMDSVKAMETEEIDSEGGKGQDGFVSQDTINKWMDGGLQKFGKAYESYANPYTNFVAPSPSAADIAYERKSQDAEMKYNREQDAIRSERGLISDELSTSAKTSFYDTGKGFFNVKDEDEIIWSDFIKAYPNVAKDPMLAREVRMKLKRDGKTIR